MGLRSSSSSVRFGIAIGFALLACVGGEGPTRRTPQDIDGDGVGAREGGREFAATLLPAGAWPGRHFIRHWVVIRWQGREERFEAVLQKEADVLLLVGLGPTGRIGFRISLEDEALEFENQSGRTLPFSPAYILADVQRIFYPWLEQAGHCRRCDREGERLGFDIRERHVEGRLAERRFSVADQPGLGEVVVRYRSPDEDTAPSGRDASRGAKLRRATLRNDWAGYEIEVEYLAVGSQP
jgi:hypothetical protein